MKLIFVNIMHDLYNLDSTANISQPPVPLGVLNSVTPKAIETALIDEQTDKVRYDGDVFAFTLATQFTGKAYRYADDLRAAGKKVIMGGIHVTVRPEEAMRHADAVVTGEAETLWPTVCADLLAGTLKERYAGRRGGAKKFAALILAARSRVAKQARGLLARVEQSMEAETPLARATSE